MTKDEWALKVSREAQSMLLTIRDFIVGRIQNTLSDEEADRMHLAAAVAISALEGALMGVYTDVGQQTIRDASSKLIQKDPTPVAKA